MLIQSQDGVINLLPALPEAWDNGNIKGVCARGGFEIDMEWENHIIEKVSIKSKLRKPCIVKYGDRIERINIEAGETILYKFN